VDGKEGTDSGRPLLAWIRSFAEGFDMSDIQPRSWDMHDAFLRGAQEAPEEDGPRLIYADWLQECGDATWAAYGEFIRNQVESAKLRNRSARRRARLAARQQELLAAHSAAWLGPWANVPYQWVYQRGILERLRARAEGNWIGRGLGADWGFPDRVEFDEEGRITVDYGDINWPGMYPTVEGAYRLLFTFACVRISIELWQVKRRTLRYDGTFTDGGLELELEGRRDGRTLGPGCVRLTLLRWE
jgi:uncharacterized protein (TIGR02996 family)